MSHYDPEQSVGCTVQSLNAAVHCLNDLASNKQTMAMVMAEFSQLEHSRNRLQWLMDMLGAFKQSEPDKSQQVGKQ